MKIELHCHTNRYSMCGNNTPEEMLEKLIEAAYDAVFLTEHNQVWPDGEIEELREKFPQINILPGAELTFNNPEGFAHLLVLGTSDPAFLEISDPTEALARAGNQNCLTVLAHPFRFAGGDWLIRKDAGKLPDAIEYFSPNVNGEQAEQSRQEARQLGLRLINSGDAHSLDFIDKFWVETNRSFETPAQLREIVLNRDYENCRRE